MIEEQLTDLALILIGSVLTEWILWFKSKDTLMPRQARVIVPGFPHHIVQHGHNGKPGQIYFSELAVIASWMNLEK